MNSDDAHSVPLLIQALNFMFLVAAEPVAGQHRHVPSPSNQPLRQFLLVLGANHVIRIEKVIEDVYGWFSRLHEISLVLALDFLLPRSEPLHKAIEPGLEICCGLET